MLPSRNADKDWLREFTLCQPFVLFQVEMFQLSLARKIQHMWMHILHAIMLPNHFFCHAVSFFKAASKRQPLHVGPNSLSVT